MRTVKCDLQDAIGSIHLCAGQDAGCEAAVHGMKGIFAEEDTEAAYVRIIVRTSRNFEGPAWATYAMAIRRQAANLQSLRLGDHRHGTIQRSFHG